MLPDMIRRGREPRVGITVSDATITLRITASGPDEAACRKSIAPTEAQIRELLGVLVFGEEEDELQHAVVRLLNERRRDRGGGRVCDRRPRRPLAGADADAETQPAPGRRSAARSRVAPRLAGDHRCRTLASAAAAEAMARAIRERTGADYGLAVAAMPPEAKRYYSARRTRRASCKSPWPRATMCESKAFRWPATRRSSVPEPPSRR